MPENIDLAAIDDMHDGHHAAVSSAETTLDEFERLYSLQDLKLNDDLENLQRKEAEKVVEEAVKAKMLWRLWRNFVKLSTRPQAFCHRTHYLLLVQPMLTYSIDDESNAILLPTNPPMLAKTTWTLLIYLTGPATGCMGGETVFYPESAPARSFSGKKSKGREPAPPVVVGLEVGKALLHKHGQDCLLHEGRKVTRGDKWVIRSDICVKR